MSIEEAPREPAEEQEDFEKYTIEDFQNETDLEFVDISSEEYREYTFPEGAVIRIEEPLLLHVKEDSGSHRIFDAQGRSHRVTPRWVNLTWKSKEGEPNFVK